jgi:hypothetical protein
MLMLNQFDVVWIGSSVRVRSDPDVLLLGELHETSVLADWIFAEDSLKWKKLIKKI